MILFCKLTTPKLVNEIGVAVQHVYGDEEEPEHLSLYALRSLYALFYVCLKIC